MKYFTLTWWQECQFDIPVEEMQGPGRQYRHYYAGVREQLPPRLAEFHDSYSLHDATFRSLELDAPTQVARLSLLVCIRHENVQEERSVVLIYEGVNYCGSSEAAHSALASLGGHGDLGYDEIEVLPSGFEHRLLFSSGIEYAVRFAGFDFGFATS